MALQNHKPGDKDYIKKKQKEEAKCAYKISSSIFKLNNNMWENANGLPILVGQDICGEHGGSSHICSTQWAAIPDATRVAMDLFLMVAASASPGIGGINVNPNIPILKNSALILFADGIQGSSYAYRACDRPNHAYGHKAQPIRINLNRQVDNVIADIIY